MNLWFRIRVERTDDGVRVQIGGVYLAAIVALILSIIVNAVRR